MTFRSGLAHGILGPISEVCDVFRLVFHLSRVTKGNSNRLYILSHFVGNGISKTYEKFSSFFFFFVFYSFKTGFLGIAPTVLELAL